MGPKSREVAVATSALAELVHRRRKAAGFETQVALAERIKAATGVTVHANYLSRLEAGMVEIPGKDKRDAIGAVLGITPREWLIATGEFDVAQNGHADGFDAYEGEFVGWLRSQPRMRAELDEVRETRGEEVYRKYLAALWSAWESNFRATMAALRLGEGGDVT
jgi:transcriptional regulator with XRE-family HTH domain